jgi:hypothetical protein
MKKIGFDVIMEKMDMDVIAFAE